MTRWRMDLSIIIVSWNVKEKLRQNLKALLESQGDLNMEVFVVDNNSQDSSAEMVKNEFSQVKVIANDDNLGFACANNQAISKAKGKYILLLNPDMRIQEDTLRNMVNWMDKNPQAFVAGPKLINEAGEIIKHVRRFPKFCDQLAIVLKLPHIFPNILDKYIQKDFDYSKPAQVDSVRGSFFMFRNTGKKLDERYFIWFEEVDFCRQVKKEGGEVWYTPAATVVDYVGQSFGQVDSLKKQKYFRDSMLKYFRKWHHVWQYCILRVIWPIGLALTLVFNKTKKIKK